MREPTDLQRLYPVDVRAVTDWRVQAIARVMRLVRALFSAVLAVWLVSWAFSARAAVVCSGPFEGISGDGAAGWLIYLEESSFCASILTRHSAGASLNYCQVTQVGLQSIAAWEMTTAGGAVYAYTAGRACTGEPDPGTPSVPASGVVGAVVLVMPSWLTLDAESGLALAAAIVAVWAGAFTWRAVIRTLDAADGPSDEG